MNTQEEIEKCISEVVEMINRYGFEFPEKMSINKEKNNKTNYLHNKKNTGDS